LATSVAQYLVSTCCSGSTFGAPTNIDLPGSGGGGRVSVFTASVDTPEPGTMSLMMSFFAFLGCCRIRRRLRPASATSGAQDQSH
jgi:hypothetical protein